MTCKTTFICFMLRQPLQVFQLPLYPFLPNFEKKTQFSFPTPPNPSQETSCFEVELNILIHCECSLTKNKINCSRLTCNKKQVLCVTSKLTESIMHTAWGKGLLWVQDWKIDLMLHFALVILGERGHLSQLQPWWCCQVPSQPCQRHRCGWQRLFSSRC